MCKNIAAELAASLRKATHGEFNIVETGKDIGKLLRGSTEVDRGRGDGLQQTDLEQQETAAGKSKSRSNAMALTEFVSHVSRQRWSTSWPSKERRCTSTNSSAPASPE
jgi:hypothetical protein